jgi:hypothetical protein
MLWPIKKKLNSNKKLPFEGNNSEMHEEPLSESEEAENLAEETDS